MNAISNEEVVYVEAPNNAEARRTCAKSGDVLLTVTGSRIGRVAALPEELSRSFVSQHVAILRPDTERLRPKFLSYFLSSQEGQKQIAKWQYGQTKPGLNFAQIARFEVPDVTVDQQRSAEELLERIEATMHIQKSHRLKADDLFSSLQSRAFSGRL